MLEGPDPHSIKSASAGDLINRRPDAAGFGCRWRMEDYFRVVSPGWPVRRKLSIIGENRHFTNDPVLSEIACWCCKTRFEDAFSLRGVSSDSCFLLVVVAYALAIAGCALMLRNRTSRFRFCATAAR